MTAVAGAMSPAGREGRTDGGLLRVLTVFAWLVVFADSGGGFFLFVGEGVRRVFAWLLAVWGNRLLFGKPKRKEVSPIASHVIRSSGVVANGDVLVYSLFCLVMCFRVL